MYSMLFVPSAHASPVAYKKEKVTYVQFGLPFIISLGE